MKTKFLLLNADKTEILFVEPIKYRHLYEEMSINIDGCFISKIKTIKILGVTFDPGLTSYSHIKKITEFMLLFIQETLLKSILSYPCMMLNLNLCICIL